MTSKPFEACPEAGAAFARRFWMVTQAALLAVLLTGGFDSNATAAEAIASETGRMEGSQQREPCADFEPTRRAFFGDLHVHTKFSLDASTMGTRARPADAYRFARGERVGIQPFNENGLPMRSQLLERPLDFAAVTDHSELLGETRICNSPGLTGYDSIICQIYRAWPRFAFFYMNLRANMGERHSFCGEDGQRCLDAARTPWQEIREAAEADYDRSSACSLTTFIAYEWTGSAGNGVNFHRNVIFANDIVPDLPVSYIDAPVLRDFWASLGRDCRDKGDGCDVLVIPHNSNLGDGMMFRTVLPDGSPIGKAEASERHAYEWLVEIMQHKGDSECMLGADTEDELCQFEKLPESNFRGRFVPMLAEPAAPRQFVRHALKEGLSQEERLGINPFRFGIIASTDTHLGTPGLAKESADYPGHGGAGKPAGDELPSGFPDHLEYNPGGLAGIWAEENSRGALFEAMRRRETFGTSGPRIKVRLFAGWNFPDDLCSADNFAKIGYRDGVPMGGQLQLPASGDRLAPKFAFSAMRDPGTSSTPGVPLQQVQIIKGWLEDGSLHERVFEVAGDSNARTGVDLETCQAWGDGSDSLCGVWRDPDFDPIQRAFYYARVIENPTCRWSQKLCVANRIDCQDPDSVAEGFEPCCRESHRRRIQERAWTSPIWYSPKS